MTAARAVPRPRPRDPWPWVLALLALLVYAPGLTWGLPHATSDITVRGWDVDGIGGMNVLAELHNLLIEPKPDWYTAYPLFHYLILAGLYAPYLLVLRVTGQFADPSPEYPYGFADPVEAMWVMGLIARLVTLAMATGSVVGVYLLGRAMWSRAAGVIASAIVLLCTPMVYYARTTNLDVPVLFWTVLGLLVAVKAVEDRLTPRRAIVLGILAGVAVATKDQVYGAWVPILAFTAWHAVRHRAAPMVERLRPAALLLGTSALAYAIANGIVIRPGRFVSHVRFLLGYESNFFNLQYANTLTTLRPLTPAGLLGLGGDVAAAVAASAGWLVILLGLAGLVLTVRHRPGARLLAIALAGFLLLTLVPVRHMQFRYALLPVVVLALFGGAVLAPLVRGGGIGRVAGALLLAAALAWEGAGAADLTYQMLSDARLAAGEWLRENARQGDRIVFYGATHQLPRIPAGVEPVRLGASSSQPDLTPRELGARFVLVAPDYFSDPLRERSTFLPAELYRDLRSGAAGYRLVAHFRTDPLIGRVQEYLPYVNPQVRIFEREPGSR